MEDMNGLELSRHFYFEAVHPLLEVYFPGLPHAAALLGPGSEVLGFDDAMSRDHDWGPRVLLFLEDAGFRRHAVEIDDVLVRHLPARFRGYPVRFPRSFGTLRADVHHVDLHTVKGYLRDYLGVHDRKPAGAAEWLMLPQQRLRSFTGGAVFHDEVGLETARMRFTYYPHDVWLYQMAAVWTWIAQEEHLLGRTGYVDDELGAALLAARMVQNLMRLAFLQERTYMPYAKWFGTAFQQLSAAESLAPLLRKMLKATSWRSRQKLLVQAFEVVAARHNQLGVTATLPEKPRYFFDRPFAGMGLHGFAEALLDQIQDDDVRRLAARPAIGGIDLLSDNVDLVENALYWRPRLRAFYE